MLKKKMLIALGVAAVLSVSCVSVTVWAEENAEEQTEEAEDSSNSEGEEDADLDCPRCPLRPAPRRSEWKR